MDRKMFDSKIGTAYWLIFDNNEGKKEAERKVITSFNI